MKNQIMIVSQSVEKEEKKAGKACVTVLNLLSNKQEKRQVVTLTTQEQKAFLSCRNMKEASKIALAIYNRAFPNIDNGKKAPRRIIQNALARIFQREDLKHDLYATKKTAKKDSKKAKKTAKKTTKKSVNKEAKKDALEVVNA